MADPNAHDATEDDQDDDAFLAADAASWAAFERDYYVLLGVDRTASPDAIRASFLALSRAFHPDRLRRYVSTHQTNEDLTALANAQYPVLDRAYKVLSDVRLRHVYDLYGERGVQVLEQRVSPSDPMHFHDVEDDLEAESEAEGAAYALVEKQTPLELQRTVERLLRRLNQQALEARFPSFSELSMGFDARDAIAHPMAAMKFVWWNPQQWLARTETTIRQQTTMALSSQTHWTIGGYLYDKQGLALGGLTTKLEYAAPDPTKPSWVVQTELVASPSLHAQVAQPIAPSTVVLWMPELDAQGFDMAFGVNHALTPHLHGALLYSTRDGMTGSIAHETMTTQHSVGVAVGAMQGPSVTYQVRQTLQRIATTIKATIAASLMQGVTLVLGASRQVSYRSRLAMGMILAPRDGVTLRIGFTRGSMRFVIPIFIAPFSPQSAFGTFCAATTPLLVTAIMQQVLKPATRARRRQKRLERAMRQAHQLSSWRRSALAQQRLMERRAEEKRANEEQMGARGLVILLARYGRDPTNADPREHGDQTESDEANTANEENGGNMAVPLVDSENDADATFKWIDVTTPLQFFVQNSLLTLPAASKASLLGFYNPLASEENATPLLYVRYAFNDRVFEATFSDEDRVDLPSRYAQEMGRLEHVH